MPIDRNKPMYRGPKNAHTPDQVKNADHDAYLKAACAARTPVAVFFLDGETIRCATVRQVHMFTILLKVGEADVLVYKNALKKITSVSPEEEEW